MPSSMQVLALAACLLSTTGLLALAEAGAPAAPLADAGAPAASSELAASFPWPHFWGTSTVTLTTTQTRTSTVTLTTTPTPLVSFGLGVATALGFSDAMVCLENATGSWEAFEQSYQEYHEGSVFKKAHALWEFGEGVEDTLHALHRCADTGVGVAKYRDFTEFLANPRFFTVHNALTMLLNLAEDHGELFAFYQAFEAGDYFKAGQQLTDTLVDVVQDSDVQRHNGTIAVQISAGLAGSFHVKFNSTCLTNVSSGASSLYGGVMELYKGDLVEQGFRSIVHGLQGFMPSYRECFGSNEGIGALFKDLGDPKRDEAVAKAWAKNSYANGVDNVLHAMGAAEAYVGQEWHRFGAEVGAILENVVAGAAAPTVIV